MKQPNYSNELHTALIECVRISVENSRLTVVNETYQIYKTNHEIKGYF